MQVSRSLYSQILRVMPIPCVDLLVRNDDCRILLLLRKNEPVAGQWWFPGGRVFFGEARIDTAKRKLEQECGLVSAELREIATFDLLLAAAPMNWLHFITTLFEAEVGREAVVQLDDQSGQACWKTPDEWLEGNLHPFVRARLVESNTA